MSIYSIVMKIFLNAPELLAPQPYKQARPVVPGCAGCARAHPDFGRSVNPISTRGDRLCPPNYYGHTQIFRPSDVPDSRIKLKVCSM